jgi:transposase
MAGAAEGAGARRTRIFADAGYQGPNTAAAIAKTSTWKLGIVKHDELHRFRVLAKGWAVEGMLAWISRNRRLARDFERYARLVAYIDYIDRCV